MEKKSPTEQRRQFLKLPLLIVPLIAGGLYVIMNYLNGSVRSISRKRKHLAGDIELLFNQSNVVYTLIDNRRIALIRTKDKATNQFVFNALDTECTHAKCSVHFSSASESFLCPCHGGEFSLEGSVIKQPPTKPLKQVKTKLKGKELWLILS